MTIAFGIRNIQNKTLALKAFHESLVPGGRLAVLELATPPEGLLRDLYLAYFQKLLPLIGRLFSHHNFAYQYLPESVSVFRPRQVHGADEDGRFYRRQTQAVDAGGGQPFCRC